MDFLFDCACAIKRPHTMTKVITQTKKLWNHKVCNEINWKAIDIITDRLKMLDIFPDNLSLGQFLTPLTKQKISNTYVTNKFDKSQGHMF